MLIEARGADPESLRRVGAMLKQFDGRARWPWWLFVVMGGVVALWVFIAVATVHFALKYW